MKQTTTDWLYAFAVGVALAACVVCNYYYHGGNIVW